MCAWLENNLWLEKGVLATKRNWSDAPWACVERMARG